MKTILNTRKRIGTLPNLYLSACPAEYVNKAKILDMSGQKRGRGGRASAQAPEEVEGEPEIKVGKPQNFLIQSLNTFTTEELPSVLILPQSQTSQSQQLEAPYVPVDHHWFYQKKHPILGEEIWHPFSKKDSILLEEEYKKVIKQKNTKTKVNVMGNRFVVQIVDRKCYPVYWSEEPYPVRRSGWLWKKRLESRFTPFDEAVSAKIEARYRFCCLTNQWPGHEKIGNGEVVSLNARDSFFLSSSTPQMAKWVPSHERTFVQRSIAKLHSYLPDDETEKIDHLVFIVHGIGSTLDFVETVNHSREISHDVLSKYFGHSNTSGHRNRVEFIPVKWRPAVHGDETGVDQLLKRITLDSCRFERDLVNNTILDVLFYMSPKYCQSIVSTVGSEMNRLYKLFIERNPGFVGKVTLVGHSLGSLILFDILSHQPGASTRTEDAVNAPEDNQLDDSIIDKIFKKLQLGGGVAEKAYLSGFLRRKNEAGHEVQASSVGYNLTSEGTEQPSIKYPTIEFKVASFFAMGSPIGVFVAVRGKETLGADFKFPSCPKMFNIFHPHDLIAFRVEPLIDPLMEFIPPVLMHRLNQETQTVSQSMAGLRQVVMNAWEIVMSALSNRVGGTEQGTENPIQLKPSPSSGFAELGGSNDPVYVDIPVWALNEGRRIDYVLPKGLLASCSETVSACYAHSEY
ncbi:hypothetical protein QYM36_012702, partial [Artemia franciscana]